MQEVDRLGWAATTAFRVGEWAIGVRSNTLELDALLRTALAAHVLDGVEAPRNYSIAVHADHQRGVRPLHSLWHEYSLLARSRSPGRVVRALLGYLGDHVDARPSFVRVPAVTMIGPSGAVVADPSLRNHRPRLTRLVRTFALQVADSRTADIDDSGELVVSPSPLHVDESALDSSEMGGPRADPDLPPATGRYPIRGWLLRTPPTAPEPSKARALSMVMSRAVGATDIGGQRTIDALARSVENARVRGFWSSDLAPIEAGLGEIST